MSELRKTLEEEVRKIIDEPDGPLPEFPSKPPEIETENIFDSEPADDPFEDNPMKMLRGMMGDLKDMALRPGPLVLPSMPPSEHKVRIYQLVEEYNLEAMEKFAAEIEDFLNDGYCCHMPIVVGNYVIMDFSRRKESEEDGQK